MDRKGSLPRIVMIGDIAGPDSVHVGDEAMFEANLSMLHRLLPTARLIAISLDPPATTARYGCHAVPRLGLSGTPDNRAAELARIDAWVGRINRPSHLPTALRALCGADALVISGGGNLSSTWPEHILERLALIRVADRMGKAVLILGQTFGPNLQPHDRELLAEMLQSAHWVGVREATSAALALGLGVPPEKLDYQRDDAITLAPEPLEDPWARAGIGEGPRIALTLHPVFAPDQTAWLDRLAVELDSVVAQTGARIVFVPHVQGSHSLGDAAVGQALASRLTSGAMTILDVPSNRQAVWLSQHADLVVSSRYHPLVFATSVGVEGLGLAVDLYTQIKLGGALTHVGRNSDWLMLQGDGWPNLAKRIITSCRRPSPTSAERHANWMTLHKLCAEREQRLLACLKGSSEPIGPMPTQGLLLALAGLANQARLPAEDGVVEHWRHSANEAQRFAMDLQAELDRRESHYHALHGESERIEQERREAEAYAQDLERRHLRDTAEIQSLKQHADEARRYVADLQAELSRLESHYQALHAESERLEQARQEAESYAQDLEQRHLRDDAEIQSLEQRADEARRYVADLQAELSRQESHYQTLHGESEQLGKARREAESYAQDLEQRHLRDAAEMQRLRDQTEEVRRYTTELLAELDSRETHYRALQSEAERLAKSYREAEAYAQDLERRHTRDADEMQGLRNQLSAAIQRAAVAEGYAASLEKELEKHSLQTPGDTSAS